MISVDLMSACITRRTISNPSSVAFGSIPKILQNLMPAWKNNPETDSKMRPQLLVIREIWKPQCEKLNASQPASVLSLKDPGFALQNLGAS